MTLRPLAMDHVALKVTDMDASLRFYHDVLHMELVRASNPNDRGGRSANLRAGSQLIDLFSRPDFVSSDKDKPIGMDHLCMIVEAPSADELIAYLKDEGVEVFWAPVVRHGHTSVYVYDPDGIHVELRIASGVS
jgi:catechol 2,3-dioxygenase-like lactoylglutathione lyase family enzyme